jgi:hypothetical protein
MATVQEKIDQLLSNMSGGSEEDRLKMLLYYGDLSEEFADDDDWGALCEFAVEADQELGVSTPYLEQYSALVKEQKFPEALSAMLYDLRDNRILAAMAIHRAGLPNQMQLVSAAAYNKQNYQGLKDEFAVTRFLVWSGFDINIPNPSTGMTALHKFASTNVPPGSHPRAVRWLIEHGADVDAVNEDGNTALGLLCGQQTWGEAQDQSFELLMQAGSDPFAQAKDGVSPFASLVQMNVEEHSDVRVARIDQLLALGRKMKQAIEASEDGDADEDVEDVGNDEESELTSAQELVRVLRMARKRIHEIRAFYGDPEAIERNREEAGNQAWDSSSGEQYLKRIYQVTMGLAIRNNLFGRPEFYSQEVAELFKQDEDFAFFFDPSHVLPLMDCFRDECASKVFLGIARPDQEQFAKDALIDWKASPRVRQLVTFTAPDEDDEYESDRRDLDDLLNGGMFTELECEGFGAVARMASFVHLSMLFESGWASPFMGIRREGVEIPDALSTRVAVHIINRCKVRDGVEGRAFGLALQSFCMQLSQGLLSGPAIPEGAFIDVSEDACVKGLGEDCRMLPVLWRLSDDPYSEADDAVMEKVEMPPQLQALRNVLQEQALASDEPADGDHADSANEAAVEQQDSDPARLLQAEQTQQQPKQAKPQGQAAAPAKAAAQMAPQSLDELMKFQGVAWGNDGKPVKVSLGDK